MRAIAKLSNVMLRGPHTLCVNAPGILDVFMNNITFVSDEFERTSMCSGPHANTIKVKWID